MITINKTRCLYIDLHRFELDIVNNEGGVVTVPCGLPGAAGVPEVLLAGPLAVVVPPGFAVLVVGEEAACASHSVVQDHVEVLVKWSHLVSAPDVSAAKTSKVPEVAAGVNPHDLLVIHVS